MDLFGSRLNTSPIDPRVIEEANRRMQRQVMIDTSPVGQVRAVGDTTLVGGVPIQPQAQRGGLSLQGMLDVASMAPGIGDFIGPLNDAQWLYRNPEERTPLNYGLAGLGALPFLPSLTGVTRTMRPVVFGNKGEGVGPIADKAQALGEEVMRGMGDVNFRQPKEGVLVLDRIVFPKNERSRGKGTEFMTRLANMADENGVTLALTPSNSFGGSVGRLKEFYRRFGFVPNKGRTKDFEISESMIRLPKK